MRRKGKSWLAILLAGAMTFTCVPVNVLAEENTGQETDAERQESENESENSEELFQIEGLSITDGADVSALKTPAEFSVSVDVKNIADTGMKKARLKYESPTGGTKTFSKSFDEAWNPEDHAGTCEIPVSLSRYADEGTYKLKQIGFDYYDSEDDMEYGLNYIYNEDLQKFVGWESDMVLEYSGEVDFTVAESPAAGKIPGEITSISLEGVENQNDITTPANMNVNLEIPEVWAGGIGSARLVYTNESGEIEFGSDPDTFHVDEDSNIYTIPINLKRNAYEGEYKLQEIQLYGFGNLISYYVNDEDGVMIGNDTCTGKDVSIIYNGTLDFNVTDSDPSAPDTPTQNIPELTSVKIKGTKDKDAITTPENFSVEIGTRTDEGTNNCSDVSLTYENEETHEELYYDSWSNKDDWTYEGEDYVCSVPITLNKYFPEGKYKLKKIYLCDVDGSWSVDYYYDSESGAWKMRNSNGEQEEWEYDGAGDFTVTESKLGDVSAPTINSMELLSENPVVSGDEVQWKLNYNEDVAGVSQIIMNLSIDDSRSTYYDLKTDIKLEEGKCKGENQELIVTAKLEHIPKGNWKVDGVDIMDFAGNNREYVYSESEQKFVGRYDSNCSFEMTDRLLQIEYAPSNGLKVASLKMADNINKGELKSGDKVEVIATVYNDTENPVTVYPEKSYMQWNRMSYAFGQGDSFVLQGGATAEVHFTMIISKYKRYIYDSSEEYQLTEISFNGMERDTDTKTYMANWFGDADWQVMNNTYGGCMESFLYNNEINFTVNTADAEIAETPVLEEIVPVAKSVSLPGKLSWKLNLEENDAALSYGTVRIEDENHENWSFYRVDAGFRLLYSQEEKCYFIEIELDNDMPSGKYHIEYLSVTNEGDQSAHYKNDGKGNLVDERTGKTIECSDIEITSHVHKFDGTEVILKEPTCTETGLKKTDCSGEGCSEYEEIEIPATGHEAGEWEVTKEATCTEAGEKVQKCTKCGAVLSKEKIKATGHKFSAWKTTKSATALATGKQERTCSVCKKKETKTIAKLVATGKLTMTTIPMKVKQSTTTLKVTGLAKGDSVKSYKVSSTKIATVTSTGKITAKAKGNTTLTVTLASGKKLTATIKVQTGTVKTTKVSVNTTSVTVSKGKTYTLKTTLTPLTSQEKATYATSNKSIATVSSTGVVKGIKKGTATITVKSGSKSVKVKVTVK